MQGKPDHHQEAMLVAGREEKHKLKYIVRCVSILHVIAAEDIPASGKGLIGFVNQRC